MKMIPYPRMGKLAASASKLLASLVCLAAATATHAQDSADILRLLVQKGLITEAEAEALVEEARQSSVVAAQPLPVPLAPPPASRSKAVIPAAKGWPLEKLSFSGRLQAQYVNIDTDIDGAADPASVDHFFMRRAYLGTKAQLVDGVTGVVTYDFVSNGFDAAYIDWKLNDSHSLNVGLTKVPFAFEEQLTSSGSLKAIERSAVTRFFVEPNNGRRLGAGVYRNGLFLNGKRGNWAYSVAATNPERVSKPGDTGSASNNGIAPWGYLGYKAQTERSHFFSGLQLGYLPDQGGKTLGAGNDLMVAAVFADFAHNDFRLSSEFMWSDNERGASANRDANSWGYFVQPSYRFSDQWEGVARFSYVDTDGRGISLSDAVRSAPSGGTMDTLYEAYLGGNWYFNGDNFKLQFGAVYGKSEDALSGAPAEAESIGLRSMLQLQY